MYAGSTSGVVQMPVSNCGRQRSCSDCVLARDPYCAWDLPTARCALVGSGRSAAVQSLVEGDTSKCPQPGTSTPSHSAYTAYLCNQVVQRKGL